MSGPNYGGGMNDGGSRNPNYGADMERLNAERQQRKIIAAFLYGKMATQTALISTNSSLNLRRGADAIYF